MTRVRMITLMMRKDLKLRSALSYSVLYNCAWPRFSKVEFNPELSFNFSYLQCIILIPKISVCFSEVYLRIFRSKSPPVRPSFLSRQSRKQQKESLEHLPPAGQLGINACTWRVLGMTKMTVYRRLNGIISEISMHPNLRQPRHEKMVRTLDFFD